jgi:hypothetical protein
MKKIVLGLIFVLLVSTIVFAQQGPQITIVNNTGYTVWYVYVSFTASDSWGNCLLRRDQVLRHGESITIRLSQPINVVNRYDIRLVDLDGDTYTKWNHLVTANGRVVFTFNDIDW